MQTSGPLAVQHPRKFYPCLICWICSDKQLQSSTDPACKPCLNDTSSLRLGIEHTAYRVWGWIPLLYTCILFAVRWKLDGFVLKWKTKPNCFLCIDGRTSVRSGNLTLSFSGRNLLETPSAVAHILRMCAWYIHAFAYIRVEVKKLPYLRDIM